MKCFEKKSSNNHYYAFFLLLISTCFQKIIFFDFGGFAFKLSHFVSFLFLPLLFNKNKIKLPPKVLTCFFIFMLLISGINLFIYGFDSLLLNYIFSFYYLILILSLGENITKDGWVSIIQKTAMVVLGAVLIKDIINIKIFITFFKNPYVHPKIYTFFGGGVNMEATWIALLGISFYKTKKGIPYSILSLIISALYTSRVGIIASLIVLLANYISTHEKDKKIGIIKISNLIYFMIGFVAIIGAYKFGMFDYVIKRFFNTGDEPGSIGRLSMWEYVFKAFIENPFGYGVGNAIKGVEKISGIDFIETNVHNIFFQMLLDLGGIGLIWYIIIIFTFLKNNVKKFFEDSFIAFISIYILLSCIQFRGGDAILFFVIGIYLLLKRKNNKEGENFNGK